MKIFITGSKGFIGSYLMKEFPDAMGIDIIDGDDILNCHLPDADIVIHLAAESGVLKSMQDPYKNTEVNILGTIRLIERYKDSKFIFASSGGAIQPVIESPYGLSKYCCEEYIKLLHKNYRIVRFPNVYGKGSRSVIDKFLKDDIVIYGDGSATRTYGHISDIIRGIKMAIDWPVGTYKLGGNQNFSVLQLAEAMGKPITLLEKKAGELDHSSLPNLTPDWESTVDAIEYIKNEINN